MHVRDWIGNEVGSRTEPWPPASIVQKLYQSRAARSFDGEDLDIVTKHLGYYCDLQSVHSEDVITYNFFGITGDRLVEVVNWLSQRLGLHGRDTDCEVSCWRRIPHPDTLVSGCPESDALLVGDKTVVMVEAKWKSSEGKGQGKSGKKTQLRHRNRWCWWVARTVSTGISVFGTSPQSLTSSFLTNRDWVL